MVVHLTSFELYITIHYLRAFSTLTTTCSSATPFRPPRPALTPLRAPTRCDKCAHDPRDLRTHTTCTHRSGPINRPPPPPPNITSPVRARGDKRVTAITIITTVITIIITIKSRRKGFWRRSVKRRRDSDDALIVSGRVGFSLGSAVGTVEVDGSVVKVARDKNTRNAFDDATPRFTPLRILRTLTARRDEDVFESKLFPVAIRFSFSTLSTDF